MPNYVFVDLETQSAANLTKVGTRAYLRDSSTRLLSAVFLVDGRITVWVPPGRVPEGMDYSPLGDVSIHRLDTPPDIVTDAIDQGSMFVAHNADNFDRLAWEILIGGPQPAWYDTIHACRANSLPAGLDRASKALGGRGKDKEGSRAMKLLTRARRYKGDVKYPKGTEALWIQLLQYNVIDVLELKRVFDATGVTELELLRVHQRINDRGIPVDINLARRLQDLWTELGDNLRDQVAELTNGKLKERDLNSPAKVKTWLAQKGFHVRSLARQQMELMLSDPEVFFGRTDDEALALITAVIEAREQSVRAAPGKLERVLGSVDDDNRVRGCFIYYGAHTGRWSARELQPHNFPRGLDDLDIGGLLERWSKNGLELSDIKQAAEAAGGSVADALGTLMRPVIRAPEGRRLVICDYASVEARCVAWMSRDDAMLNAFRERDIYCEMASEIFGRTITKADKTERQIGKVVVLGCGYQMGSKRFAAVAALQGCNLAAAGVSGEQCVRAFRQRYRSVPKMWKAYGDAFHACVEDGGEHKAYRCIFAREDKDVCITLPPGRRLRYRDVDMEDIKPVWGGEPVPTPTYAHPRGYRRPVFGGYLTENISQATCRDLLAAALMELDKAGWPVVMHVHDEIVCECAADRAIGCLHDMLRIMSTPPKWAEGFPMVVEGFVSEHYVKNPSPGSAHGKAELGKVEV